MSSLFKNIFFLNIFLIAFNIGYGQAISPKTAKDYFNNNNFIKAAESYEYLLKAEPENKEYLYRAGFSYLNCNTDRTKAAPFLEKLHQMEPEDYETMYQLALAYHFSLKIDKALELFTKYQPMAIPERIDLVKQLIKNCHSAKQLMQAPVSVSFHNLGPEINTEFPDYYPFVAKDESYLVFTSRRRGNTGGIVEFDGYFSSDIWVAANTPQGFGKARNAGNFVNSDFDEQAVGLSDDGSSMFVYADKIKDFGDIYISQKDLKSFKALSKLDGAVNSSSLESAASLSEDGNTLFFSSDRPGGQGGLDLYMTRKLPTGEWAEPQNIGNAINTTFDEDFPTLSADGKTLYFCSEGHKNMGGFDIFKSIWDPVKNIWSTPVNIGFPINSPQDERVISFTQDGYHAYISSSRKGGMGDLDIYKITFTNNLPQAIIYLSLPDETGNMIKTAEVSIMDEYDSPVGYYSPSQKTGKYLMVLPTGKYFLYVDCPGKIPHTEELILTDKDVGAIPMDKKIILKNK